MDEEGAVENLTRKTEKWKKAKAKKVEKNEENRTMGIEDAQSISTMKAIEDVQMSEKQDVAELKGDHKRDKRKKNKNKETTDAEAEIKKKGAREGEFAGTYSEDGSGDAMGNVERKTKKREKKKIKDERFERGNTVHVEGNESEKLPEGESISRKKSHKEAKKERKNQKALRNRGDGDIEKEGGKYGKGEGTGSEHCKVNDMDLVERKKRKREKEKSKYDKKSEAKLDSGTGDDSRRTVDNENDSVKVLGIFNEGHVADSCVKAGMKGKKKRAGKEYDEGNSSSLQQQHMPEDVEGNTLSNNYDGSVTKEHERKKKSKTADQQYSADNDSNCLMCTDERQNNEVVDANKGKKKKIELVENGSGAIGGNEVEHANKGKKKQTKSAENGPDDIRDNGLESGNKKKKKKTKLVENGSNDPTPNKSNKKVRFSGQDEVFPVPGDLDTNRGNYEEDDLVRGKRFTREEDEIVKEAVFKYIADHDLGDEGLDMVLNCKKHPQLKGCWKEIGSAIPYRPYTAIYYRAQVLFRRSESRKWTQEEYDEILKYQEEHGNQWRALADELGKHRWHVKDTWRRIKLTNRKKGNWSQGEYQELFDLVNTDLQSKVFEEKRSKHGMLRDNICWTAISDQLSTRPQATCCLKWYKQLTSPMVAEGIWADTDDYRLISALYSLDATCMEDVDWDNLVDNRSGEICRKRWNQMVLHIGKHGNKSFAEQVEVLAQRYCPHLLEAREAWDSKPRVP
ncbi:RNA polymerase I termination factor [Sesamum indicum]|uniref:RNA polymerase I termination factor n=1 Tax=Sesamum indicum TaxID=4182 RepID=A0A6I9UPC5_SESIN|nr:RNA polymerase I termination factor [Sesamum indicum]